MTRFLEYSHWHRTLGFGFFAMDIDSIEIRDGSPVGLIEVSSCTPAHPKCSGENGVFNRFLRETGGFQIELAWWTAKWLEIPAFVTCIGEKNGQISVLSLTNGRMTVVSEEEYVDFLGNFGCTEIYRTLTEDPLPLNELLELLSPSFPGLSAYPYFKNKDKWTKEYLIRINEVQRREKRKRPIKYSVPNEIPVKRETTNKRPSDYLAIRSKINRPFINLEWVEWRKEKPGDLIGRPAALIKTSPLHSHDSLNQEAELAEANFKSTPEYSYWICISQKLLVPFYSVHFSFEMDFFYVFKYDINDIRSRIMTLEEYKNFVCSL